MALPFPLLILRRLLGRIEARALIVWAAAAGALWAFVNVAGEMREGETTAIDRRLLLDLRSPGHPADPIGPRWFEESMRDVTALGGVTFLTLLTITAIASLLFHGKRRQALVFAATMLAAQVSSGMLKGYFDRPRPTLVPHGSYVYSQSFPSGHSTLSAAAFLTLAAVLSSLERTRRAKIFDVTLAIAITVSVGFSRVYLGVHWPTDVLGGWALGSMWALAAVIALNLTSRPLTAPGPAPAPGDG